MGQASARILGHAFGLTAMEMNHWLKDLGYLEGEPGVYRVTEMGKQYAAEKSRTRGTGGYSQYNPSWETRTWDTSIVDGLDLAPEMRHEIRAAAAAMRRAKQVRSIESSPTPDIVAQAREPAGTRVDGRAILASVLAIVFVTGVTYGVLRAAPVARKKLGAWQAARSDKSKRVAVGQRSGAHDAPTAQSERSGD